MAIEDNDRAVDAPDEGAEPQEVSIRDALEASVEARGEQDDAREPAAEHEEPREEREDGRERDESGRFKPREKAAKPVEPGKPIEGQPAKPVEGQPPVQAQPTKAPQSWKPGLREKWGTLPPDVQQEVLRRENEIARTLQETAEVRRSHEAFRQVTAPFDNWIRAQGMDAPKMIGNLLNMAATLQFAPRQQQAKLIADLWRNFMGVDEGSLQALDAEVTKYLPGREGAQPGQPAGVGPQDVARLVQQQLQQERQQVQQQAHQQLVEGYKSDLSKFAESHEFFADVKPTMLKLMEAGLAEDYAAAYDKAVALHPDIAEVLAQREAAGKTNVSTQRAVRAARSLKPSAATPAHAKPPSTEIGDILREKFTEAQSR